MNDSRTIVFCCNWSSYPGLQMSKYSGSGPEKNHHVIVNMCSGRISPEIIMDAFRNQAAGVLIASCPLEECEHDANYKTRRRIMLLKRMLNQFGIEPERIQLEWIDKGESQKLQSVIEDFTSEIDHLGPIETYQ